VSGAAHAQSDSDASSRLPANRPPKFLPAQTETNPMVTDWHGPGVALRSERIARVVLAVEDVDGDPLTFGAHPLPAGAAFDEKSGVLTWKPTRAQEGKHAVEFEATDGRAVARYTISFVVRPNRAPVNMGEQAILLAGRARPPRDFGTLGTGDHGHTTLAVDGDSDDVSFVVRARPAGARLTAIGSALTFSWRPAETDVGKHELVVDVSDGELRTTVRRTIVVFPEESMHDYRGWFLLGGGPSAFVTHDDGEFFVGGAVDASLVALIESATSGYACANDTRHGDCHASHHRFYAEFEVLDSMRSGARSLFTYAAGYSASFEWLPGRRYLVPHYGIELGGLVRDELGHRAQTRPYLGLHLFSGRDVWLNATAGYRVVPAELYGLSGPTFALRAVIDPW
jgi:hypothetical protein